MKTLLSFGFIASKEDLSEITTDKYESFKEDLYNLFEKYELSTAGDVEHLTQDDFNHLEEYVNNTDKVTRVEVISEKGREYVNMNCKEVEPELQDDNRTLKIFLK